MAWSEGVRSCGVGGARHVWPRLAGLGQLRLGPVLLGSTGRHLAGSGRAGPVRRCPEPPGGRVIARPAKAGLPSHGQVGAGRLVSAAWLAGHGTGDAWAVRRGLRGKARLRLAWPAWPDWLGGWGPGWRATLGQGTLRIAWWGRSGVQRRDGNWLGWQGKARPLRHGLARGGKTRREMRGKARSVWSGWLGRSAVFGQVCWACYCTARPGRRGNDWRVSAVAR